MNSAQQKQPLQLMSTIWGIPSNIILGCLAAASILMSCVPTSTRFTTSVLLPICDGLCGVLALQCALPRPRRSMMLALLAYANVIVWSVLAFYLDAASCTAIDVTLIVARIILQICGAMLVVTIVYADIKEIPHDVFRALSAMWYLGGLSARERDTYQTLNLAFSNITLTSPTTFPTAKTIMFVAPIAWLVMYIYMVSDIPELTAPVLYTGRVLLAMMLVFIVIVSMVYPGRDPALTTLYGARYTDISGLLSVITYTAHGIRRWLSSWRPSPTKSNVRMMPVLAKYMVMLYTVVAVALTAFVYYNAIPVLWELSDITDFNKTTSAVVPTIGVICSLGILNLISIYWAIRCTFDV